MSKPIDVFLAGIMQGSHVQARIHDQDWREPIKAALARHLPHARVYCHYAAHPDSLGYDLADIKATLADGNRRAGECDLLIAYVPSASMGTAIEMHEAARGGAAVVTVSPLATNWVVLAYSDAIVADLEALESFAASGELAGLLERKRRP